MNRNDGLVYMLAFCLLLTLVHILRSTPPPSKKADVMPMPEEMQLEWERNQAK